MKLFFPSLAPTEKILLFSWSLFALSLFLYSFTQIDLGLVISRYPFFYEIERSFQYIGYFQRPLSTYLYIALLSLGFLLYGVTLWGVHKRRISLKGALSMVGAVSIFLAFSYNAFSYDFFNYIFDAKILTHYGQNPYLFKALDFPQEPMLAFMHWTHRVYPYGPIWLILTVPVSFIGGNIFLITFFLFKLLTLTAYLLLVYFLYHLLKNIQEKTALFSTVLIALNPLILIELLVSSHNDGWMFALALAAMYYLEQRKHLAAYVLLGLSIGIKFATGFLLPVFLLTSFMFYRKKTPNWDMIALVGTFCMFIALIIASSRTNFQPWYTVYLLPFLALFQNNLSKVGTVICISLCSLLLYVPFLYMGEWTSSIGFQQIIYLVIFITVTGFLLEETIRQVRSIFRYT